MSDKTFKVTVKLPRKKFGFIQNRRVYNGDEIEVTEKQYSPNWMVKGKAPVNTTK